MTQVDGAARSDLNGAVGWMVFGFAILAGAWQMDRFESMGATLHTAPGLVPGLYGIALIALGAALAWRSRHARGASEPLLNRRLLPMLVLTLAYAGGMVGRMPFTLATALFVSTFCWLYAEGVPARRRLVTALLCGVLTAAIVVLVFERVFLVRLP